MCTIGAIKKQGMLFKNRDKILISNEELIVDRSKIVLRSEESENLAAGLNKQGVGFVTADIDVELYNLALIEENRAKAEEKYMASRIGENPTKAFRDKFGTLASVGDLIEIINNAKIDYVPYKLIACDTEKCYLIETKGRDVMVEKVVSRCETNHFSLIDYGPKRSEEYESSFTRYIECNKRLRKIEDLDALKRLLGDHTQKGENSICRHGVFKTNSSIIIDIHKLEFHHSTGPDCNWKYRAYKL